MYPGSATPVRPLTPVRFPIPGVSDPGYINRKHQPSGGTGVSDPGYIKVKCLRQSLTLRLAYSVDEKQHLRRLDHVWIKQPCYFITTCVGGRRPLLASAPVHEILREEWKGLRARHGWMCGSYVVMPDHVHVFITPVPSEAKPLSGVMAKWKEWTAKRILRLSGAQAPLWQPEFFDHVLRSEAAGTEKWNYVRQNPVRAGLVARPEDWPFAGHIDFE
jgi:REP element-mobilizing transposase RayT